MLESKGDYDNDFNQYAAHDRDVSDCRFPVIEDRLIDEHAQLFISNLTINVLLPASVFTSFLSGMSMDLLLSLGTILILAIGLEVFLSLASKTGDRGGLRRAACVAHYGYLVSNGGCRHAGNRIAVPVLSG